MLLMRFTLSLVLIFVTGGVAADCKTMNPEAMEWLDKMSRSAREVSYQGVITLQRGDDMQVVQVSQHLREGYRKEVMTQLTGQGAQVQRDHPLHCVHPGQEFLRFGEQMRLGDCGIAQQYRFSVTKGDRVAGRRSVQVRIEPRDMYRYG